MYRSITKLDLVQRFVPQPRSKAALWYKAATWKLEITVLHPGRGLSGRRCGEAEDSWCHTGFTLYFDDHVNKVVRTYNYHLRSLWYLRHSSTSMLQTHLLAVLTGFLALITATLCSPGTSDKIHCRFQRLQNDLAERPRGVFNVGMRNCTTTAVPQWTYCRTVWPWPATNNW